MGIFNFFSRKTEKKIEYIDKRILKSLERIHSAVVRRPKRVDNLERAFIRIQTRIQGNLSKIKSKDCINATIQLVKGSIREARHKNLVDKNKKR